MILPSSRARFINDLGGLPLDHLAYAAQEICSIRDEVVSSTASSAVSNNIAHQPEDVAKLQLLISNVQKQRPKNVPALLRALGL